MEQATWRGASADWSESCLLRFCCRKICKDMESCLISGVVVHLLQKVGPCTYRMWIFGRRIWILHIRYYCSFRKVIISSEATASIKHHGKVWKTKQISELSEVQNHRSRVIITKSLPHRIALQKLQLGLKDKNISPQTPRTPRAATPSPFSIESPTYPEAQWSFPSLLSSLSHPPLPHACGCCGEPLLNGHCITPQVSFSFHQVLPTPWVNSNHKQRMPEGRRWKSCYLPPIRCPCHKHHH